MSWDDFWAFFRDCNSDDIRSSILEQIHLADLIKNASPKVQYEILSFAPEHVIHPIRSLITTQAKKRLGISAIDVLTRLNRMMS